MKNLTDRIKEIGERELERVKPDPGALEILRIEARKNRRPRSKFQFYVAACACVMFVITIATAGFLMFTPAQKYGHNIGQVIRYKIRDQAEWNRGVEARSEFPLGVLSGFDVWSNTQFVTAESDVDVAYGVNFNKTFSAEENRLERDSYEIMMLYRDCDFPFVYEFERGMTARQIGGAAVSYKSVAQDGVILDTYITFKTSKCRYYIWCNEIVAYGHKPCETIFEIAAKIIEAADSVIM